MLDISTPVNRKAWPAWRKLLGSRDFRAVALLNAVMFATTNGGRAVLMPLMAVEHFSMTPSILGVLSSAVRLCIIARLLQTCAQPCSAAQ